MTTDTVRAPAEAIRRPSRGLRQLVPWLLALAVTTCTQDNVGPSRGGVGYFSFRPVYPMASGISLSQFGIVADSVHIVLTRPVNELVLDTTVAFPADSTQLRLALPVELASSPEVLDALIEIRAGGVVIFRDSVQVTVKDGAPGSEPPPAVTFQYVGPGSNIETLSVLPGDTTITLGDTLFFTASAIDSNAAPVANFYVGWKSSDTALARINAAGRLIAPVLRGAVRVIGLTPTGIADTTVVTFAPVPVIITADSGNLQSAVVGDSLGTLLVARVKGADSLGISGIPVRFAAVTAGGGVRDTVTLLTDANGRVRTRAILGTIVGGYTYTATALGTGLPARTFTATATVSAASAIAIDTGNAQVDTVTQTLASPLVAHVTDAFGNDVVGAPVVFTRTFGSGTLADDTVLTVAGGLASVGYTLGGPVGTDSIRAELVGTSGFVMFTARGIPDTPATNQLFSGDGQTAAVSAPFALPLVVQVEDGHNNPVPGAKVGWSIVTGLGALSADTTVTDSIGRASITVTAGTLAADLQINAQVPGVGAGATITLHVTAGAPATMVIVAGNGQAGPAGIALSVAPEVLVQDAFSNAVPGVAIDFAVVAGGGTLDSAAATTDSLGHANAGIWTLGLAGLNTVRATTAAVPADTLLFDATATPAGTSKLWTGAVDGLWTTAGNWSPAGMPVGGDNLYVPAGVTSPVLNTPTVTGGLAIETGATVTVTSGVTLQLSGNLDLDGDLTGAGNLTLTGSGATLNGNVGLASVLVNGTLSLNGATTITGPLNVNSGTLTVGGQTLSLGGALTVGGSGQLVMTNAADSVDVGGNVSYSSSNPSTGGLTAGTLVIRGNLTQTAGSFSNFAASGAHTVRFAGSAPQSVSFASPGATQARFQNVAFDNSAGVTLATDLTVLGATSLTAGTVTGAGRTATLGGDLAAAYAGWQVSTTSFTGAPAVYPDSLPRHVTLGAAWTLTKPFKADSSLAITNSGVLTLNGNTLRVGGTFTQGGILRMQNTGDTLDVAGMFTVNSGAAGAGDLTGGMIRLHGGFTQSPGSFSNYQPSGSHVTRFEGLTGQPASLGSAGASNARFQHLEIADSVNFAGPLYVAGNVSLLAGGKVQSTGIATLAGDLSDPTDLGWRYATTQLVGAPILLPDSMVTDLSVLGSWTLAQRTRITGTLAITSGGQVDLNGDTLIVSGAMTQGGVLTSANANALLDVGGAFVVNSGASGTGSLSAGHLVLRQGFAQSPGSFSNFVAGAGFLTTFAGTGGHTMSFSSPGTGASVFSALEVFDSLSVGGSFTTTGDVMLASAGRLVGAGTGTLLGGLVDSSGLGYRMTSTTIPGGQVIPAAMTTDLSLTGPWTLPGSFSLTGNFSLPSGADLNTNGHRLSVSGTMVQGGILRMLLPADTVEVNGLFTVNSGTDGTGHLVDGRLLLHAGFTQSVGSFNNFMPSSGHVTEFVGAGGHPVSLSSFSAANSHFQHLIVRDSLAVTGNFAAVGDVTLDPTGRLVGPSLGVLLGNLVDSSLAGWRMASTQLDGRFQSIPSALVTNVTLTDSIALAQNTSVTGGWTLTGNGYIAFSGHGLGVSGNFTQNNRLVMNSTQDSLDVGGLFTVSSGADGTGDLTAGVLVLRGGFTQSVGSFTNFMADAPHRTRFTGPAVRTIDLSTPNQAHFGDLEIDAGGAITLNTDVHANGAFTVAGGPVSLTAAAQRLLRVQDLAVNGLSLDRVRLEMHGTSNAAQFDNVTFTNIDPALDQLSMELPGLTGDTLKFTNVAFSGTPTTGRYLFVADSVANGAPAIIGLYNSSPLNGALYAGTEGSVGDVATILWSHLEWITQPSDGTELLPIVSAPQVGAYDPSGQLVTGYTGTVTLGFLANPGGAVLAGNSVAAVGGVATFDALTLSLAGTGYQLEATSAELGASPPSTLFNISIPFPAGTTTAFNNGGGDNDWANAANWTAGVPDSADNVYVFPSVTSTVNTPARANRVVVGTGGGIVLNASLTVDSSVAAGNTISGGGLLIAQGSGTLTGQVGDLYVTGTYVVPTGGRLSAQNIVVAASGVLDPGLDTITVADSLATQGAGVFNVNGATAVVEVSGDARFGGGASTLTSGTMVLRKGLYTYLPGALAAAPAFTTSFQGTGSQTVVLAAGDSANALGSVQMAGDTLVFVSSAWITGGLALNGGVTVITDTLFTIQPVGGTAGAQLEGAALWAMSAPTFPGSYGVATTIFAANGTVIPALAAPYDTLVVLANVLLGNDIDAGTVYLPGIGQLDLNGQRLTVAGDLAYTGLATLKMMNAADSLLVGGSLTAAGGATDGLLTAGLLTIGGNFTQSPDGSASSFRADSGHTTRFAGGTGFRTIYFGSPVQPTDPLSNANSRFGRLELVDGVDSLAATTAVVEDLVVTTAQVLNTSTGSGGPAVFGNVTVQAGSTGFSPQDLSLGGVLDFQPTPDNYQVGTTLFFGDGQLVPVLPYGNLQVAYGTATLDGDIVTSGEVRAGTLGLPGTLDIGGHTLTVGGSLIAVGGGTFVIDLPTDSVDVAGPVDLGGAPGLGYTAGVLVARGDFYLQQDSVYIAGGGHRTLFANTLGAQLVNLGPELNANRFNKVRVLPTATVNLNPASNGALFVTDSLQVEGNLQQASTGQKVVALGALDIATGGNFTMDSLELHGTVAIGDAGFSTYLVRYAGPGQVVYSGIGYNLLEVTGTAALENFTSTAVGTTLRGSGQLTIGPWTLSTPTLSVIDNATLAMTDPTAAVDVSGDVLFAGGQSTGLFTGGHIGVGGNFTQLPGSAAATFDATGTQVTFNGVGPQQVVTITDGTVNNFRGVGITNPAGIQINGLMLVTDSVSTVAAITGDSLYQFGSFFFGGAGSATVGLKVLKTSGLFVGTPATYTVGRTHITNANSLPNVPFDTLVINASGVSAFSPLSANVLYVAGAGSAFSTGAAARLDLGINTFPVAHFISGDLHIEGSNASLEIAEDTVNVSGDFYTSLGGTLQMNGPGALLVAGSTLFGGASQVGQLTAGTLQVGSGITQQALSSPSSFRMDGTVLDLPVGPVHVIKFDTPDNSWLPDLNNASAGTLALAVVGRVRVAGGINGYGVSLSGDSLWIDGMLTGGPNSVTANIAELRVGQLDQFGNFSGIGTFVVGTGHITGAGALPFNLDPIFDSLFVHDSVQGQLSQIIATKYLEVTGPGNPRNLTGVAGRFYLIGGDGNTQVNVNGDVLVRGTGAAIINNEGYLQATGDLTVDQKAYLAANGSFSGGNFDIDGSVVFDGVSTRDSLVQGSLMIGGKFTQLASSSSESFAPDSLFNTQFKFTGTHNVSFATPSPAGGGGSHFGGLSFSADAGLVMETDTDLWVEGILGTQSYSIPVLRNISPVLRTLEVRDVSIQGITFDHFQLHLAKAGVPAVGTGAMDIVNFNNFLPTEDQFLVDLPGQSLVNTWSNVTFTQLDTLGGDTGHYLIANDVDGGTPDVLTISLGGAQINDPGIYFVALNGAIINFFAP